MGKMFRGFAGAAVAALFVCGCYNYKAPAVATMADTYSERKKDAADDIFKDIKVLTLLDAQRIAIRNNPTYIAAYHAVEAARMRYYQAWGAYSPTITASYDLTNRHSWGRDRYAAGEPRGDTLTNAFSVNANLLIFDGFSRYFNLKAAKSNLKYQELMEENDCRTMMLSVAYAYNTVLLAIEQRRIAMEDRKFQLDSLQNTQYKFEAGAAPLSDVLNFEILVNNAEVNMIAADYSYDTALYALAVLMGYPDGTLPADLKFSSEINTNFTELPAVEIYLDAALANRPDLKAYRERLNIAKYDVYKAWGAFSPTVNAFASYSPSLFNEGSSAGATTYYENHTLSYGVSVDWTVFNGAVRYNKLREAQANMAAADFQVAAQWFNVVDEVRTAYANYIQSVKKTKLYARVRELSAKQRDLVDDEYRAGNAELTRLNEAQRDLVSAETSLASSYINVQNAKAQLDSVVGGNTAEYYLNDADKSNQERFPGLGNLPEAIKSAESETAEVKSADKSAAPAKTATPAKAAAPAIPASATAAPAK